MIPLNWIVYNITKPEGQKQLRELFLAVKMSINMPPPVKEPITFLGWIEEIFKIPLDFPRQAVEVYRDEYTGSFAFQVRSSKLKTSDDEALISAFVESPEAFKDLAGVNTTISLEKLYKTPLKTINAIGQKTLNDIARIDDVSSLARSQAVEALTRGQTSLNGKPITEYKNRSLQVAKAMGVQIENVFGLVDPIKGSRVKLLDKVPGTVDTYEDRRVIEESENRNIQHKTYTVLSGALTGIASDYENPSGVLAYRNQALFAYNESITRELGIDLEQVLPTNTARRAKPTGGTKVILNTNDGSFLTTLNAAGTPTDNNLTKLQIVLSSDAEIEKALSIPAGEFSKMPAEIQDLHKGFLEMEFRKLGLDLTPDPTDPKGKRKTSSIGETSLQSEQRKTRKALEQQFKTEAYRRQINASIEAKILAQKPTLLVNEVTSRNAAVIAGTGPAPHMVLGGTPRPWSQNDLLLDGTIARIDLQLNQQKDKVMERLRSATKSMDLAHNLYFAATTKNLLEAIEKGSFLNTFLISSRFAGTLPFISETIWDGKNNPLIGFIDDKATWLDDHNLSPKYFAGQIGLYSGIAYEAKSKSDLKGLSKNLAIESRINVEWKTKVPGAPAGTHVWHQATVKASEGAGLFGDWGLFDTINRAYGADGQLIRDSGISFTDPNALLSNQAATRNFFDELNQAATDIQGGVPVLPPNPYEDLAKKLGLDDIDSFNAFQAQYQKYKSGAGGENLLFNSLSGPNGIEANGRWDFLTLIRKEGKENQFLTNYMGALNWYNRKANTLQSFFYKQILFGGYGGNNALLKFGIKASAPIRTFLQTVGMADEITLAEAISHWKIVRRATRLGKLLSNPNVANPRRLQLLGKLAGANGKILSSTIAALAKSTAGRALLQSAGYLLSGLGGALTGGIGWVVAAFGDVAWAFGKNALKLDFKGAYMESKKLLQAKWEVVKKVVIYPLTCCLGCIVAPIGLIIIVIASQLANFGLGGGSQADLESKMIDVSKTSQVSGNKINYTITITNISGEAAVDIATINDRLSFTYPCDQGGSTTSYTGAGWVSNVTGDFPTNTPRTVATSLSFTYSVENTIDGTYFNTIEITAVGESGRSAISSVSNNVGRGGCITCPTGWPFTDYKGPLAVTQGPHTTRADSSHGSVEAVDIAPSGYIYNVNNGQKVIATHRGTVSFNVSLTGYGNLAIVTSDGGYSTYYAHLNNFDGSIRAGDLVEAGRVLGIMGNIGNSSGTHLHYEFRPPAGNPNYECLAGHKLKLESVNGQSYIPKTIPVACYGSGACNISVP